MRYRSFGSLGEVSALSLGGGGIGRVYGDVASDEAEATVRAGVDAGINLLDLAPTYGPGESSPEAELVVQRAFGGQLPDQVLVSSKVAIEDPSPPETVRRVLRASLRGTLQRLGRDHLDLYILHSYIRPSGTPPLPNTVDLDTASNVIRPEFEELVREGTIRAWGMTGTAATDPVCEMLEHGRPPMAVQCVTNAIDAIGDLWPSGLAGSPDNSRIRATAVLRGVSVMGIRALAAGALADRLDRVAPVGSSVALDSERATPFLALAREHGVSPAHLAHRYAVSLPDIATLVIGAKTRHELTECLAAEEAPPMSGSELSEIEAQARLRLVRT